MHFQNAARIAPAKPALSGVSSPHAEDGLVTGAPDESAAATPLERNATRAAELMRQLGNDRRILLICCLIAEGEVTVSRLAEHVGLSMSAVSQHLKVLRWDGLVAARRQGAEIHYRIADERVLKLVSVLQDLYATDADRAA